MPALCTPQGRTGAEGFPASPVARVAHETGLKGCPEILQNQSRSVSRNLCRNLPEKIGPVFLQYENCAQPIFVPPWQKFTHPFGNLIWGDLVHYSALVCLLE